MSEQLEDLNDGSIKADVKVDHEHKVITMFGKELVRENEVSSTTLNNNYPRYSLVKSYFRLGMVAVVIMIFCSVTVLGIGPPSVTFARNVINTASVSGTIGANWKHMDSNAALYDTGDVNGLTKIWSSLQLLGWTGATKVIFVDANGVPIGQQNVGSWGVDGTVFGRSTRTETWSTHAVPETRYIMLVNYANPQFNAITNIVNEVMRNKGPIEQISFLVASYGATTSELHVVKPVKSVSGPHGTISLFYLLNPQLGDYLYTTSEVEANNILYKFGYLDRGIAGYLYPQQQPNTVPLYRYYNPHSGIHYYTTSIADGHLASTRFGYQGEGIAGYLYPQQQPNTVPLYRYYNPHTGAHFYTISAVDGHRVERDFGYQGEGIAGYLYPSPY